MKSAYSLLLVVLALCPAGRGSPETPAQEFLLTVTLTSTQKPVQVRATISLGRAFEASEQQANRRITIKGALTEKKRNLYHLRLTIVDWTSETSNSTESYEPDLILGEPWRGGFISSFIYLRTVVLLTRAPAR